jgi:hypothetical protein
MAVNTRKKSARKTDAAGDGRAGAAANRQRALQAEQDRRDQAKHKGGKAEAKQDPGAVQAGPRKQPERMPAQHLQKPGLERDLQLEPQFMAPDYAGSRKLQDMAALITGGDSGIGRAVAVLYAREGADVAIVYLDGHEDAEENEVLCRARRPQLPADPGRREGRGVLPRRSRADGARVRPARRGGQQRCIPGTRPDELAEFGKHTDMKRAAQPEELSPAYVFLAAPVCSSYITGIVLPVTGSVGAI